MVATPVVRRIATLALTALIGTVSACSWEEGEPIADPGPSLERRDRPAEQQANSDPSARLGREGSRIEPRDPSTESDSRSEVRAAWTEALLAFDVPVAAYVKEALLDSGATGLHVTRFDGEVDWNARLISDELTVEDMTMQFMRSDRAVYLRTGTPTGPCGGGWVEIDGESMDGAGLDLDPDDVMAIEFATILHDAELPRSSTRLADGSITFEVEVPGTVGPSNSALLQASTARREALASMRNTMDVTLRPDGSIGAMLDATASIVALAGSSAPDDLSFFVVWHFEPRGSVGPLVEPIGAPRISDC